MSERPRIVGVDVSNFLSIRELSIEPDRVTVFAGTNGRGKSTALSALRVLLGRYATSPADVRESTDGMSLEMRLSDGLSLKHRQTRSGSGRTTVGDVPERYNVDDGAGGVRPPKLRELQAQLAGGALWDPFEFFRIDWKSKPGRRQGRNLLFELIDFRVDEDAIRDHVGTSTAADAIIGDAVRRAGVEDPAGFSEVHGFDVLEALRLATYELRHKSNEAVTESTEAADGIERGLPADWSKVVELDFEAAQRATLDELETASAWNEVQAARARAIDANRGERERLGARVDAIAEEIRKLEAERDAARTRIRTLVGEARELPEPEPVRDVAALRAKHDAIKREGDAASDVRARVGEMNRLRKAGDGARAASRKLDALYKRLLDEIPRALLASVEMPIEGLSFDGEFVNVNGREISRLSTGEKLAVSFELAKAAARRSHGIPVIVVDDLDGLGPELLSHVCDYVNGDDSQYFLAVRTVGDLTVTTSDRLEMHVAPTGVPEAAPKP